MITILKRLAVAIPTLLALTFIVFLMVKAIPGDPAQLKLGERATPEALKDMRRELGLDQPFHVQYGRFLYKLVVEQDLGRSIRSGESISQIISEKFPATIELAVAAIIFALLIGIPAGVLAAIWPGSIVDFSCMSLAVVGVSMPIFWLALMLIWAFGLQLQWFPITGRLGIDFYYEANSGFLLLDSIYQKDFGMLWDAIRHLVLPAVALGTIPMAFFARMTRASMLEVMKQDYVKTAQAKGLPYPWVICKHCFKNASIPIVTIIGLQFGMLLGGAVITETIFAWPGLGSWLLESVSARDVPAIEAGILLIAATFVIVNAIVDLLYVVIDPRIRLS